MEPASLGSFLVTYCMKCVAEDVSVYFSSLGLTHKQKYYANFCHIEKMNCLLFYADLDSAEIRHLSGHKECKITFFNLYLSERLIINAHTISTVDGYVAEVFPGYYI